ncbi:STN domain-containing protein [Bradyrhizobium sp. Arg237L]|uniref:STN domain-containing protein n=1 Tax=Bradyrhizobium sp. Arg237L TaxID=3003352 RepID=UPI00249D91F3|nr:STN domain-containing protein [Bradyrhizobium sp. Arg237L]MDI4233281.1 STN domain-containing protein [Bradyrhizobium sp. Arg237L]
MIFVLGITLLAHGTFAEEVLLDFNIRAQPLPAALEQYAEITGRNILYNSDLVVGRRVAAVQGRLSPDAALTRLLDGSKLSAVQITATSFTLVSAPVGPTVLPQPVVTDYYGKIQVSLHNALCGAGAGRPGNYRIGMRLWIDSAGSVTRYERLNSTGVSDIDAGIDQALQRLKIGARPPAELTQPVSVVIIPKGPGVTMSCVEPASSHAGVLP